MMMKIASKRTEIQIVAPPLALKEKRKRVPPVVMLFCVRVDLEPGRNHSDSPCSRLPSTSSSECHGTNGSNKLFTDLKTRRWVFAPLSGLQHISQFPEMLLFLLYRKVVRHPPPLLSLCVHLIPDATASHAAGGLPAAAAPVDHAPLRDVAEDLLDALVVPPTLCPMGCNRSRGFMMTLPFSLKLTLITTLRTFCTSSPKPVVKSLASTI